MADEMKVHAYQVTAGDGAPPLETLIQQVGNMPLINRLAKIGTHDIRLEHFAAPFTADNPTRHWLMDFTKIRFEHGPGKAGPATPIVGFAIANGDGFGEETAALYDPDRHHLIVQYNHHGVRAASIERYFSSFYAHQAVGYDFMIRMDLDSEAKLARKTLFKKIIFKVATPKMTVAQRNSGVGLNRALELADHIGGEHIEITISSGRNSNAHLNTNNSRNIISGLRRVLGLNGVNGADPVEKFEVIGKDSPIDRAESIDMLAAKLEQKIDQLVLGADLRFTQESRWRGLVRARNGWNQTIGN